MFNVKVKAPRRDGSRGLLSLLLSFAILLCSPLVKAACVVENDDKIQINISPETLSWGSYLGKSSISASRVIKCQEEAGKFLMISLGSVQWGPSSETKDSYIFNTFEPGACRLENSRSINSYQPLVTKNNFDRQYKFIRSCIDLRVADTRGLPLIVNEKQEFCDVQRIDESAVVMRGNMCFVKIRSQNDFSIQPLLREECLNPAYLEYMGIEAQDIYANLDTLVSGDDSGVNPDVRHVGSRPLHINITPQSGLLALSEDFGTGVPRFTTTYNVDGDWGGIEIRSKTSQTQIDLSFFVSNVSERQCKGATCSSSSNFSQPFVGQIELFKLSGNGKAELIEEWWDGGLVPPNWQGVMKGIGYRVPDQLIQSGAKYRLVATFQDPTDDYAIFLNGLKQMLIRLYNTEGATVGIDSIPAIPTLGELGVIPNFTGIGGLHDNNQTVSLSEAVNGLEKIISSTVWPPYYDRVCASDQACMKLGRSKFHQRLVMEFVANMPDPAGGRVLIEGVKTQKSSPLFQSYPMQVAEFPSLKCER